jgi:hypothetical protein
MMQLTVTYTSGYSDIGTCTDLGELHQAIEAAKISAGYVSHHVKQES